MHALRRKLLDIDGFETEELVVDGAHLLASASGAREKARLDHELVPAIGAVALRGDMPKMEDGVFGYGAFRDLIPVQPDRVRLNGGHCADRQMNVGDLGRANFFGSLERSL
jgi:hypothetical protein